MFLRAFFSLKTVYVVVLFLECKPLTCFHVFMKDTHWLDSRYEFFPESLRLQMLEETKNMFYFAYESYMRYAFPMDELDPVKCSGRGPDFEKSNININDVLGDYCLTLVDTLDTLAIIGNASEFQRAVTRVIQNVGFDKDNVVQVFEANIRILGSLLSAHLLIEDTEQPFGFLRPSWYDGELLQLAHDLASRLLPAFEKSPSGIPFPRVNLRQGLPSQSTPLTCTAGAGSFVVEFGLLSRLLDDPVYEGYARRAVRALWNLRHVNTGLLGNVLNFKNEKWVGKLSGLGAGLDSFYEYLLKSYIIFGEEEDYKMFLEIYSSIKKHIRRGRPLCNQGSGDIPLYVNVHMASGDLVNTWIDSLQASFAGVQVLSGDIEEAICFHALYYALWKRFGVLPERWDWYFLKPEVKFYPLRPEFIESTYLLYQATKNPFYLHVGKDILFSFNNFTKTKCGYATIHNVVDKTLEDRMESFFLSESCKYLYLLFDTENYINKNFEKFIFTTEGHVIQIDKHFLSSASSEEKSTLNVSSLSCSALDYEKKYSLPLRSHYLEQISHVLGVDFS